MSNKMIASKNMSDALGKMRLMKGAKTSSRYGGRRAR